MKVTEQLGDRFADTPGSISEVHPGNHDPAAQAQQSSRFLCRGGAIKPVPTCPR